MLPSSLRLWAPLLLLTGCAATNPPPPTDFTTYVVLGDQNAAVARVLIDAPACPAIVLDQRSLPMTARAPAQTVAARAADARPTEFPLLTCEATLPAGLRSATVLGRALPLPKAEPQRIVLIGNTGCRLEQSSASYQACNDDDAYRFAALAAQAAAWRPDLVIHLGNYHSREAACPEGNTGCAGSPWGYGWDTWDADLFAPAAALLDAAPWIVARGEHESCQRAGQGWWRFLDPRPLQPGRDCQLAANDARGDQADADSAPLSRARQLLAAAGAPPLDSANYLTLLRRGPEQWEIELHDAQGQVRRSCRLSGHSDTRCYIHLQGETYQMH